MAEQTAHIHIILFYRKLEVFWIQRERDGRSLSGLTYSRKRAGFVGSLLRDGDVNLERRNEK